MGSKPDKTPYLNRELSWIDFHFHVQVLEEAMGKGNPLMKQLDFLSIPASHLDEVFMVWGLG